MQTHIDTLGGQGFVELIDRMGDDRSVVRAARVSFAGDETVRPPEDDQKLIKYLLKNHHTSPFEHVVFTFHASVPIFVARQWMRHRTWAYNEISARYTEVGIDYYWPDEWRAQSSSNRQASDGLVDEQWILDDRYGDAVGEALEAYQVLLNTGVSREMARMVLPQAMFTRFYGTVSLHNLIHFIRLRDHSHAQQEIQEYARAMRELIAPHVPWTIQALEEIENG